MRSVVAQAAGLHELEVHAVHAAGQVADVGAGRARSRRRRPGCRCARAPSAGRRGRRAPPAARPARCRAARSRAARAPPRPGSRRRWRPPGASRRSAAAPGAGSRRRPGAPSFTLTSGKSSTDSSFSSISAGAASPSVTQERGAAAASSPSSRHTGSPSALADPVVQRHVERGARGPLPGQRRVQPGPESPRARTGPRPAAAPTLERGRGQVRGSRRSSAPARPRRGPRARRARAARAGSRGGGAAPSRRCGTRTSCPGRGAHAAGAWSLRKPARARAKHAHGRLRLDRGEAAFGQQARACGVVRASVSAAES